MSLSISSLLSTTYPIIQAPMFQTSTPQMAAAAGNAGCLGSLALGDLPASKCIDLIRTTKSLSAKPFAVNIFLNEIPQVTSELRSRYATTKQFIETLARQHGLNISLPEIESIQTTDYHDQLDAIISENCKILSFTFGNLDAASIQRLKSNDVILIGTCTSVQEAIILEQSGIDIICVQGIEAGGHRGAFASAEIPGIGGLSLLSQVFDAVKTPLIYAGGIYNARTLFAAKTLGAQGFQIGSLLLCAQESAALDFEKARMKRLKEQDIVLTNSFSGRYARGIRNVFIDTLENTEHVLPYPYQNKLTAELRRLAKAQRNPEFISLWVGQSITKMSEQSTTQILQDLIRQCEMMRPTELS